MESPVYNVSSEGWGDICQTNRLDWSAVWRSITSWFSPPCYNMVSVGRRQDSTTGLQGFSQIWQSGPFVSADLPSSPPSLMGWQGVCVDPCWVACQSTLPAGSTPCIEDSGIGTAWAIPAAPSPESLPKTISSKTNNRKAEMIFIAQCSPNNWIWNSLARKREWGNVQT